MYEIHHFVAAGNLQPQDLTSIFETGEIAEAFTCSRCPENDAANILGTGEQAAARPARYNNCLGKHQGAKKLGSKAGLGNCLSREGTGPRFLAEK